MSAPIVEYSERPPVEQLRVLEHVHVNGRCVKSRLREHCPPAPCPWAECDVEGLHSHEADTRWVNPGDRQAGEVHIHAGLDGLVTVSEKALSQLLTDAGWERVR